MALLRRRRVALVTSLITAGFMGQRRLRRETLSDVVEAGRAARVLTGEIAVIGQSAGALGLVETSAPSDQRRYRA